MPEVAAYPLKLCIGSIVTTSLGLAAAALNLQWSAAPKGDALAFSWLYVQVMLTFTWLVLWPAVAHRRTNTGDRPSALLWQLLAILTGALPAAGIAVLLSNVSIPMAAAMAALQLSFAILTLGILAQLPNLRPSLSLSVIAIIAALMLAAPVAAFLAMDFFPNVSQNWREILPAIATAHAARHTLEWSSYPSHFWITTGFYGLVGMTLFASRKTSKMAA